MKRTTLLAVTILVLFTRLSTADLIVDYNFNGNALDSSGNGNNGTIVGSPVFVPSDTSQAILFNNPAGEQSATQFVALPNSASILGLNNDSFTFALRFQSTDASLQNGRLFGNTGGHPGGTGILTNYQGGIPNSDSFVVGAAGSVGSEPESASNPFAFTADGRWHWAVTVLDRNTSTFSYYVDGHLIVSKSFGSLGSVDFSNLLIGANSFDGVNTFFSARQTSVDEFRLYSNALSTAEVNQLVTGVPEPSSLLLLGLGLAGFAGLEALRRRRKETKTGLGVGVRP